MFTGSFFPENYFAPRYFPKTGLTPPGIIRVVVNGNEITDQLVYRESITWNLMRGSRGTCSLPFIVEPGEAFAPQIGELIQIYDPADERVWYGKTDRVRVKWLGDDGWHVVILDGISLDALFDTIDIEKVKYTGQTAADVFTDLHTRSGVSLIGLGTITGSTIIESLEVTNIAQGFSQVALMSGGVWYVDPLDGNLYLHAPGARAADFDVVSTDILWESMEWQQAASDLRNVQVIQMPGVAMTPFIQIFDGDDVETVFTLASVPEYIISIVITIGSAGRVISWTPGTAQVSITPALPTGASVEIRYSDEGLVVSSTTATLAGAKTLTYTHTRTFTQEGAQQQADALTSRYSLLPSELVFSTDKAGLRLARNVLFDLDFPASSGDWLNGHWLIREVQAIIVPGLDQRTEPFGHFRYTLRCVNSAATAIVQGDGVTTEFELPVIPTDVTNIRVGAGDRVAEWLEPTQFFTIVPALEEGQSAAVDYIDPNNTPDVESFVKTWEDMVPSDSAPPVVLGSDPPGDVAGDTGQEFFLRTLTLYDLAVGDDIAPHTLVYADGMSWRLIAVLRKDMDSDLTVRINKGTQFLMEELITVTIPGSTVVDTVFEWPLTVGSPAVLFPFFDLEIMTADILESDGSSDTNGVIQFTVMWTKQAVVEE